MSCGDERPAVAGEVIELDRLIAMANQIGDFFAPYPPERAREGLRNHLRTYWDPRMRSALLAHIDAGGEGPGRRRYRGRAPAARKRGREKRLLRAPTGLKQQVDGDLATRSAKIRTRRRAHPVCRRGLARIEPNTSAGVDDTRPPDLQGHRAARLKVTASKGGMATGSSSLAAAISVHCPSRNSNASSVRSRGSTSHRWRTPSRA